MNNDISKLVLLDSSAIIHRAYHGLPPLSTHDGVLVNAVYGYITTYFKVIDEFKPKYIVATFDEKGPTVRHHEYKEYKAHRPAPPDDLIKQFQYVKDVCKVLNIPVISLRGYEADDVIGTIVEKLTTYNLQLTTIIVTGDMDALQLVNDNVVVYSMSRGIKKAEIYDAKKVKEKYGFEPSQLIDYKALRGDPSDNIPGVPGIGEVTATNLIKEFGTVEKLYEEISNFQFPISNKFTINNYQFSKKLAELLIQNKDQAFLSKKLATIIKDVPINFDLSDALTHDYDKKKAEALFRKLEFKSLINRLPKEEKNNKQTSLF
jgi:DNA polymerase-1